MKQVTKDEYLTFVNRHNLRNGGLAGANPHIWINVSAKGETMAKEVIRSNLKHEYYISEEL